MFAFLSPGYVTQYICKFYPFDRKIHFIFIAFILFYFIWVFIHSWLEFHYVYVAPLFVKMLSSLTGE